MTVKCSVCGNRIDKDKAFLIVEEHINSKTKENVKKNIYYCSKEEYLEHKEEKEKNAFYKDKIYCFFCDLLGSKAIINTLFWKEWGVWNKIASNEMIFQFIENKKNNFYYARDSKANSLSESGKIFYYSAIIKNGISDFQKKYIPEVVIKKPSESIVIENISMESKINQRKALLDLEDF